MQRTARLATIALLVAGAVTTIALVGWSFYIRSTAFDERLGRASLRSGLELAARLNTEYLAGLAALAAAALALAYVIWREPKPWAYLASAVGAAATIAGVWWGRAIVLRLEDPHFVKKSPWVKAATFVATSATIFLALLCVTATVAWLSQRNQAAKT
ncbi:MAG TPA: hypothetical protein VIV11_37290 [Kofleriaceae bacterium]